MINATLCSTNSKEPWAANVDFEVNGSVWVVELNAAYTHYKNIVENKKVVVAYKTARFEIIAKGSAVLTEAAPDGTVTVSITLNWLRLIENEEMEDYTDSKEIDRIVTSHT